MMVCWTQDQVRIGCPGGGVKEWIQDRTRAALCTGLTMGWALWHYGFPAQEIMIWDGVWESPAGNGKRMSGEHQGRRPEPKTRMARGLAGDTSRCGLGRPGERPAYPVQPGRDPTFLHSPSPT